MKLIICLSLLSKSRISGVLRPRFPHICTMWCLDVGRYYLYFTQKKKKAKEILYENNSSFLANSSSDFDKISFSFKEKGKIDTKIRNFGNKI